MKTKPLRRAGRVAASAQFETRSPRKPNPGSQYTKLVNILQRYLRRLVALSSNLSGDHVSSLLDGADLLSACGCGWGMEGDDTQKVPQRIKDKLKNSAATGQPRPRLELGYHYDASGQALASALKSRSMIWNTALCSNEIPWCTVCRASKPPA